MKMANLALVLLLFTAAIGLTRTTEAEETSAGWRKYEHNPVLGGKLGTCFDVAVLREGDKYRMWFSWRPKQSIALVESRDGINWSEPVTVLEPNKDSGWEDDVNRPIVVKRSDGYHIWYTGQRHAAQADGRSWIGYATSADGKTWKRMSNKPVLSPDEPWEKVAVMCPHVIWDEEAKLYRMWYSGGEQIEPNEIGYATSQDGIRWRKLGENPIFRPDPQNGWEQHRVTACQIIPLNGRYYMFYIGFSAPTQSHKFGHAQIGLARSKDGIRNWKRLPGNPIIRVGVGADEWDHDSCYKPYAVWDGKQNQWLLWYNGRRGGFEQIGLAIHEGHDLGF